MSEEFKKIKEDLSEIDRLMKRVVENWDELDDEEFYELAENYPDYLPSFEEFEADLNKWLIDLLDKE
ncbi:hypothetical protein JCM16358_10930 [Halanaerocella petrolearia]